MLATMLTIAALATPQGQRVPADVLEAPARQALAKRLAETGSHAELRLLRPLHEQALPSGQFSVEVGDIAGRLPRPQVAVPIRLRIDGRTVRTVAVRFELHDERTVLTYAGAYATRALGETLRLQNARVDMACCVGITVTDAQQVQNLRLKRGVRAGQPVLAEDFEAIPEVQAHEPLAIEVESGPVRLTTPGVALADGRIGEWVAVRATASGEVVEARVVAPQKVAVHE